MIRLPEPTVRRILNELVGRKQIELTTRVRLSDGSYRRTYRRVAGRMSERPLADQGAADDLRRRAVTRTVGRGATAIPLDDHSALLDPPKSETVAQSGLKGGAPRRLRSAAPVRRNHLLD